MSYDEYLALPPEAHAEWVDGEVVMNPSPSARHQQVSYRIHRALEEALPTAIVIDAVTVRLPGHRERVPDVIVLRNQPGGVHPDEVPVVAVEVMSPSSRAEDTVRKSVEYLFAGVRQYWVADLETEELVVYVRVDGPDRAERGEWDLLAVVDHHVPTADVEVADLGTVHLDRAELFRIGR